MTTATTRLAIGTPAPAGESGRAVRDSAIVVVGGQVGRLLGTLTSLALRWGLDPERMGVYTGLRLYLDNTNRSSLGIGLGAVQMIPILRAEGRHDEARRVADVAYTATTLTCLVYAAGLLAWTLVRAPLVADDPMAAEWTWGLVAVAGLTLLQRHQSFLTAILRAEREFALTTELDVVESLASAAFVALGLWLAGFWGLLAAVGALLGLRSFYLHMRHPLRLRWAWDRAILGRLLRVGLPILANTAAFGALLSLDRVLILWRVADGARAAGLYTVAILGTNWSLDLAGRIVTVLYPYFQTTLGRTRDHSEVARQASRATLAQAPLLAAGASVAYLAAPAFLGALLPRYVDGLPALRPLLPGMVLLGLTWPARQMLIAVGRPYRLLLATLVGLALTAALGAIGAGRAGIVGVAWAMSAGFGIVHVITSMVAYVPALGWRGWSSQQCRLLAILSWSAAGAFGSSRLPVGVPGWGGLAIRGLVLVGWTLPMLWGLLRGAGAWRRRRGMSGE